jgi:hypothetical protein
MFKGIANLGSLLKQAQQMGSRIGVLNDQLRAKRALGSAGGGMVEVEVNGLGEVLRVTIDPKLVENNERDMIEDLVPAAVNQAVRRSKELYVEAVKTMTNGIPIPGLDEALTKFTSGDS